MGGLEWKIPQSNGWFVLICGYPHDLRKPLTWSSLILFRTLMRIWCTIWCRSQLHNSLSWSSCVEKGCFSRIGTSNPWCWFKPFGGVVVPFRSISLDVSLTRLSNGFWWFVGSTMLRSILLVPAWQSSQSTKMKELADVPSLAHLGTIWWLPPFHQWVDVVKPCIGIQFEPPQSHIPLIDLAWYRNGQVLWCHAVGLSCFRETHIILLVKTC